MKSRVRTESDPSVILSVEGLSKRYGDAVAVDAVSFAVRRNEIVGLLGPNGAGKTTTINMILGVLEPDSGTVRIDGFDIESNRSKALERTNFATVYSSLPGNLTVTENLRFFGLIYGVGNLKRRIDELLAEFDLGRFRNTRCGVLSSGEQTRVSLAKAMLNRPTLLLLDEPTASLDPSVGRDIRDSIRDFTREGRWRRSLDFAQHERSGGSLRPRPLPVARENRAGRQPARAAGRARQRDAGGLVYCGGARAAHAGACSMSPKRAGAIALRQFYLYRGSPARILPMFAWVAIDVILWGFITRYLNSVASAGFNFVPAMLGAVLLWDFLTRVMQGVTTAFFEDVWSRNFLNVFATPLSISEYVTGLVLSSIATSAVGLAVMLALATTAFGLSFFIYGPVARPISAHSVSLRHLARHFRLRRGAAPRTRGRMADLAHSGAAFSAGLRLLPAVGAATLDAISGASAAAIVGFRIDAASSFGRHSIAVRPLARHRPRFRVSLPRRLVFHAHLSIRAPQRTYRTLQR